LLAISGGDGTYEELVSWLGKAAVERGYNLLAFEMPGQFGTVLDDPEMTYRTDTWVPIGAAVDYALTRPEVDPERLALVGYSWGGTMGPRAVTREKRIKAIIANSLVPECRATILMAAGADPDHPDISQVDTSSPTGTYVGNDLMWRCGFGNRPLSELAEFLDRMSLWGLEDQITTPLLNITASAEGATMQGPTEKFFNSLSCPKTAVHLDATDGAEVHCQANNPSRANQIEFDWLDETFNKQTPR
jgi:pimeloyl-ACP methyl ester carboxylesterase